MKQIFSEWFYFASFPSIPNYRLSATPLLFFFPFLGLFSVFIDQLRCQSLVIPDLLGQLSLCLRFPEIIYPPSAADLLPRTFKVVFPLHRHNFFLKCLPRRVLGEFFSPPSRMYWTAFPRRLPVLPLLQMPMRMLSYVVPNF